MTIGRKLLEVNELHSGAFDRYIRDVYTLRSNLEQTFDEFKLEWSKNYDKQCEIRNIEHPIEFNKEVKINTYVSVSFFKRRGEDWSCNLCDMAPNGGSGHISLAEALNMCGKSNISELL